MRKFVIKYTDTNVKRNRHVQFKTDAYSKTEISIMISYK